MIEHYRLLAQGNDWGAVFPEILLALFALTLLILELVVKRQHWVVPTVALVGFVSVFALVCYRAFGTPYTGESLTLFNGLIKQNLRTEVMRLFFLLAGSLTTIVSLAYLNARKLPRVEFLHIVLIVTAAFMLLVQSNHFVMFFLALETVTVGFYVLVSYNREKASSLEAGLKYLIQGALSSSILLFGIVLLFGAGGNPELPANSADPMNFDALKAFILANPQNPLVIMGTLLVLAGLAFKIGAVPFQIWIPDVYQGAPTPVMAMLGVASKAAGFFMLLILIGKTGPFNSLSPLLQPVLAAMAVFSILYGNITATSQFHTKRILGFSGIAHAGYLLLGVTASVQSHMAPAAVFFYLFIYMMATFLVAIVVAQVSGADDATDTIDDYRGLAARSPLLSFALVIGLGSLAGIPPLAGFIAKVIIFIAAFEAKLYWPLAVACFGVAVSIYYYFGWMRSALFRSPLASLQDTPQSPLTVSPWLKPVIIGLASFTIVLGFYQGVFGGFIY